MKILNDQTEEWFWSKMPQTRKWKKMSSFWWQNFLKNKLTVFDDEDMLWRWLMVVIADKWTCQLRWWWVISLSKLRSWSSPPEASLSRSRRWSRSRTRSWTSWSGWRSGCGRSPPRSWRQRSRPQGKPSKTATFWWLEVVISWFLACLVELAWPAAWSVFLRAGLDVWDPVTP